MSYATIKKKEWDAMSPVGRAALAEMTNLAVKAIREGKLRTGGPISKAIKRRAKR